MRGAGRVGREEDVQFYILSGLHPAPPPPGGDHRPPSPRASTGAASPVAGVATVASESRVGPTDWRGRRCGARHAGCCDQWLRQRPRSHAQGPRALNTHSLTHPTSPPHSAARVRSHIVAVQTTAPNPAP